MLGIQTSFQVESFKPIKTPHAAHWQRWLQHIEYFREMISSRLELGDKSGWLRRYILNEKVAADEDLLRIEGFVHVFTMAGLHLVSILGLLNWVNCRVGIAFDIRPDRIILASRVQGAVLVGVLWALQGMRLGMLRPIFLLGLKSAARHFGFRWSPFSALATALILDLGVELGRLALGYSPEPGRLHYALAVGGALYCYEAFKGSHVALSVGSWIAVAVFGVFEHSTVSLLTPIWNLIWGPVLALLTPALLISLVTAMGHEEICTLATGTMESLTHLNRELPNLWVIQPWSLVAGAAAALGFRFLIAHKLFRVSLISVVVLGVWMYRKNPASFVGDYSKAFRVAQLNVGQGDSGLYVLGHGDGWLLDTGADRAKRPGKWIETLARHGVRRLSRVVFSHLDADHVGGIETLARLVQIDGVVIHPKEMPTAKANSTCAYLAAFGIQCQPPDSNDNSLYEVGQKTRRKRHGNSSHSDNANMLGSVVNVEGRCLISLGDASARAERMFLPWILSKKCPLGRILKVSHHGSRYSTSQEFLRAVNPMEAWISSGMGNRYLHPHPDVLTRLGGIGVRRTDREGDLTLEGDRHRPP